MKTQWQEDLSNVNEDCHCVI